MSDAVADPSDRTLDDTDAAIVPAAEVEFDQVTDVVVAGAGGCGLTATLAAADAPDVEVILLEKASTVGGNAALSTGMIPAAGTSYQQAAGITETPAEMAADIMAKNDEEADASMVQHLCETSVELVHWLVEDCGLSLQIVDDFKYPQHSEYRMHAPPGRNGENLVAEMRDRIQSRPNTELRLETPVERLVTDDGAVQGVLTGGEQPAAIRARRVILGTDGFAGNSEMVGAHCDADIADAFYYGSPGNTGDGIRFGAALGGALSSMDAFQGHATVVSETEVLSTYAVVMNGGIILNLEGERFGDESKGYSAFAVEVVGQPGGVAIEVFDERIFERLEGEFEDFDKAIALGSYTRADTIEELAETLGAAPRATREALESYNAAVEAGRPDEVGRLDGRHTLSPPFYGTKVTGSLFHTQGGLVVDDDGRVLREDGSWVRNLYAGGGTATGISGHGAGGYLSGNGLTTAMGFGLLAGRHASRSIGS